jgi:ribonuclease J
MGSLEAELATQTDTELATQTDTVRTSGMKARIVRGATEVGGSCVELESQGKRLVVDLGRPLASTLDEVLPLPDVAGLADGKDPSLLGVLISHSHPDHYGLVSQVPAAVPAYIGAGAARVLKESAFFSAAGLEREWAGLFTDGSTIQLGPFEVTALAVDHSAFDAYALVIRAGGRVLVYSGDLRGHGADRGAFSNFLVRLPLDIDAQLLEGTTVGRDESTEPGLSEGDVEERVLSICDETSGLVLACFSTQNLQRLKSFYRATLQAADRQLALDPYTHAVAVAAADEFPRVGNPRTKLYVPQSQRVKIKNSQEFGRVNLLRRYRLFPEQLAGQAGKLVMVFRPSMAREFERAQCLEGARVIWSMWPGYLKEERMKPFADFLERNAIPLTVVHSSGHATVDDLQRVATAAGAARVVPIHTNAPERYPSLFKNVEPHSDGEWWAV